MSDIVTGDFNYGSVDSETAAKLEYFAKAGKSLIRKSQIQFIAEFGKVLSEARDLLSDHHNGTFVKWSTAEFDLSAKTVYNYVNAWDRVLCNGYTTYLHWTPTALYLLASDDTPKPVQKKLEKMGSSDLIRRCDVQRLIDASKPTVRATVAETCELDENETKPLSKHDQQKSEFDHLDKPPVSDDVPFDAPEGSSIYTAPSVETKPERTTAEQAKLNRQLAQSLIDKAVRAVDDLNHVKKTPQLSAKQFAALEHMVRSLKDGTLQNAAVRLLQGVELW